MYSKKIIAVIVLFLISIFTLKSTVFSQNELFFGQNHSYSIVFRGNTEAIIYARMVLNNPDNFNVTHASFEIPNVNPYELVVFQQKLPLKCARYAYQNTNRTCLEYTDPDYAQSSYYGYLDNQKAEYTKLDVEKIDSAYNVKLTYPIEPQKQTAIIIGYAAKGYVKENLGKYTFSFETIKVPSRIEKVRVSVDVDSDLILKGKKSEVNYKTTGMEMTIEPSSLAFSSPNLDLIAGRIGSYGPMVKESKNLAPFETFIVKGEYAKDWWRLYLNEIIISLVVIILIISVVLILQKKYSVTLLNKITFKTPGQQATTPNTPIQNTPVNAVNLPYAFLSPVNILWSLVSVILVISLTFGGIRLLGIISQIIGYSSSFSLLGPIIMIIVLLLYATAILGPAIYVASKHGWKALLFILLLEIAWYIIFVLLIIIFFQSGLGNPRYSPGPIYYPR